MWLTRPDFARRLYPLTRGDVMRKLYIGLVGILAATLVAEQSPAQRLGPSASRFGVSDTVEQLEAKAKALPQTIPDGLLEIDTEFDALNEELARVRGSRDLIQSTSLPENEVREFKAAATSGAAVNCADEEAFRTARRKFLTLHNRVDSSVPGISPFDVDETTSCRDFKDQLADADQAIDRWAPTNARLLEAYGKYEVDLNKRRTMLQEALREADKRQELSNRFIWYIILFGALSLGAMAIVTRFSDTDLQMEWVSSGQVTQFVTVMILLSVVTMLGLSKTISGETLGTLLGGVAGYVLAQGVGRAAARDAARNVMQKPPS